MGNIIEFTNIFTSKGDYILYELDFRFPGGLKNEFDERFNKNYIFSSCSALDTM